MKVFLWVDLMRSRHEKTELKIEGSRCVLSLLSLLITILFEQGGRTNKAARIGVLIRRFALKLHLCAINVADLNALFHSFIAFGASDSLNYPRPLVTLVVGIDEEV